MDGRATVEGQGRRDRASGVMAAHQWEEPPGLLRSALRDLGSAGAAGRAAVPTLYAALCVLGVLASLAGLIGLAGSHPATSDVILDVVRDLGGGAGALEGPVEDLLRDNQAAAVLLVAGLAATALFASLYLRAFHHAARPLTGEHDGGALAGGVLRTLAAVTVAEVIVLTGLGVVATGPVAHAVGAAAGLSTDTIVAWDIVKWPVLVALAFCAFAVLLRSAFTDARLLASTSVATVQIVAALAWVVAITGFALYLASFGSFEDTYGTVGSGIVLLVWLTMLSMLYYVTPDLRGGGIAALGAGAALSTLTWLLVCAALAVCLAVLESLDPVVAAIALGTVLLGGLWLANVVVLLGVRLSALAVTRGAAGAPAGPPATDHPTEAAVEPAPEPEPRERPVEASHRDSAVVFGAVSRALQSDVAHAGKLSPVAADRDEVERLTDLELDLVDWGFTYGAAWALARAQDPAEPDEAVAHRALAAAREVFRLYCGEDDWEERLEREIEAGREPQAGVIERHLEGRLTPADPGHGNGHGTLHR